MASRGVSVYSRHMHLDENGVIRFTDKEERCFGVDPLAELERRSKASCEEFDETISKAIAFVDRIMAREGLQ